MSRPPVIENNEKVLDSYAQRLCSNDLQLYTRSASRFGAWLKSDKAYYPQVRPKILELLEIAQATLRRQLVLTLALPIELNPWWNAYIRLIRQVIPHRSLFTEAGAQERLNALASGVGPHSAGNVTATPQHVNPSSVQQVPPDAPTQALKRSPYLPINASHTVRHSPALAISSQYSANPVDIALALPTSSGPPFVAVEMQPHQSHPSLKSSEPPKTVKTEDQPPISLNPPLTEPQSNPFQTQPSTSLQLASAPQKIKIKKKKKTTGNFPEFLMADLEWYQQEKQAANSATERPNISVDREVAPETTVSATPSNLLAQVQQIEVAPASLTVSAKGTTTTGDFDTIDAQNAKTSAEANDVPCDAQEKAEIVSGNGLMPDIPTFGVQVDQEGGDHSMVVDVQEAVSAPTPRKEDAANPPTVVAKPPSPQEDKTPAPHELHLGHAAGPNISEPTHESSSNLRRAEVKPLVDEEHLPRTVARDLSAESTRHRNRDDGPNSPSASEVASLLMAEAGSDHEESLGVKAKSPTLNTFTASSHQIAVDAESEPSAMILPDTLASTPGLGVDDGSGLSGIPRDDKEGAMNEQSDMSIGEKEPPVASAVASATEPHSVPVVLLDAAANDSSTISTSEVSNISILDDPTAGLLEHGISKPIISPPTLVADMGKNEVDPQTGTDEPARLRSPIPGDVDMEAPVSRGDHDGAEPPADYGQDADVKVDASWTHTGIERPNWVDSDGMELEHQQGADPLSSDDAQMQVDVKPDNIAQPADSADGDSPMHDQDLGGTTSASAVEDEPATMPPITAPENDEGNGTAGRLQQQSPAHHLDSSICNSVDDEHKKAPQRVFGPEMAAIAIQRGSSYPENISIDFDINESQYAQIAKWNRREETAEDVSDGLCLSLACYSCEDAHMILDNTSADLPLEAMIACGSKWPCIPGGVGMNVKYKDGRNTFPISPPYLVTPENMVDVTEFIELGPNTVNIQQYCDLTSWIFVLHAHFPTAKQLEKIMQDRRTDAELKEWLKKIKKPFNIA